MIRCFLFGHKAQVIREEWIEATEATARMPMHLQFSRCAKCGTVESRITSPFQDLCALGVSGYTSEQSCERYWGGTNAGA